jgi:hypothetical protein
MTTKERAAKDQKPSRVAHEAAQGVAPDRPPHLLPSAGRDKREIMLKPNWPGIFHRTVGTGEQAKRLEFAPGEPVEVDADQFKALKADIGVSLFEIERDEKGRPRYIETVETPDPTKEEKTPEPAAHAENV